MNWIATSKMKKERVLEIGEIIEVERRAYVQGDAEHINSLILKPVEKSIEKVEES